MRCELLLTNLNSNLTAVSEYGKKITNQKKKNLHSAFIASALIIGLK